MYKTSRAVWRWTRSIKFEQISIILDRLDIKPAFAIKSNLSLQETNAAYPHIPSPNIKAFFEVMDFSLLKVYKCVWCLAVVSIFTYLFAMFGGLA